MKLGTLELKNNLSLAPLAGITDTVFRKLAKRYGCGLVFSEMINSNGVLRGGVKILRKMDIHPEEHPAGIQIAGDDPKVMSKVAKQAQDMGAKILNINMGCPSKKVTQSQAGCSLMKDPLLVSAILKEVRQSISIPLTIKIRLGWDEKTMNYIEIAQIAEQEGCAAIFMHARTRAQAFKGEAKWVEIKKLKENIHIPVIGNGDVTTYNKALQMMEETGCDGVMIGRGALGKPWIFSPGYEPTLLEKKNIILEHLQNNVEYYGEELGVRLMQKHFSWYSHGLKNSAEFRRHIHALKTLKAAQNYIEQF